MKDGYYISTYLYINELDRIIDCRIRHDQSIALWKKKGTKIELVRYLELERVSGYKMHYIPFNNTDEALLFIDKFLEEENLSRKDIIEIWGTPELDTCEDYHSIKDFDKINYHSICHLFSGILSDSDNFYNHKILGLAVDGGPDAVLDKNSIKKFFYSGCYVENGKLNVWHIDSPAQLWYFLKKELYLREGTLMALGSASTSELFHYNFEIKRLDDFESFDSAYREVKKLINYVDNLRTEDIGILFNGFDNRFTEKENKISMIVKEIQKTSIKIMERTITKLINKYNIIPSETYLSITGGFALNCPTNSYLMKKFGFKDFISCPCVSDTGIALGVGLYAFYKKNKDAQFSFNLKRAFYGNTIQINNSCKYSEFIERIDEADINTIVDDIISGPVIWCDGNAEIGPRALGHRSILGDPRKIETKNKLNEIKNREWWRPVAPIVIEEEVRKWFIDSYRSPYMLQTFYIQPDKIKLVPAIAHLDNSARVQTLSNIDDDYLYKIITKFYEKTNVPMICNTSLNGKGEPIIDDFENVIYFAITKKIQIVYINKKRYKIKLNEKFNLIEKNKRKWDSFFKTNETLKEKELNKYQNITVDELKFYRKNPLLHSLFDLETEDGKRKYRIYLKYIKQKINNNEINFSIYDDI